jgi:hypothetical protein
MLPPLPAMDRMSRTGMAHAVVAHGKGGRFQTIFIDNPFKVI